MRAVRLVLIAVLVGNVALAQSAPADAPAPQAAEPVPQPARVAPELAAALAGQRDSLGRHCEPKDAVASGDLRYVACGEAGVWVVRVQQSAPPVTIERRDMDGDVFALFMHDGHLWAQIASVQARRIAPMAAQAASASEQPPPATAPAATQPPAVTAAPAAPAAQQPDHERPARDARVIDVGAGFVVIDVGVRDGLIDGQHVAFYEKVEERLASGIRTRRHELVAVGNVDGVAMDRARVVLGLNERVHKEAIARVTDDALTAGSVAPPRVPDVWEVSFLARPFLVLENLGAGVFADVRAGYRTDYNVHYEALVMPLAWASAEDGATLPAAAVLTASYDSRLFEVGLGIGGQTVNDAAFDLEPGTGITALQRVRLGARDGLHIEALFYVVLFHSEFEFSSVRVSGQIPMSRGTWLVASGGGGSLGIGHGELGLRMLLSGNGDQGSFFLTTTIGGVHVFESDGLCFDPSCDFEQIDYAGPMVGVGGEWRL